MKFHAKNVVIGSALAACCFGVAGSASAGIVVIDLFDDPFTPAQVLSLNPVLGDPSTGSLFSEFPGGLTPSPTIIGGYRDLTLNVTDNPDDTAAVAQVFKGKYTFSTGSNVNANGSIQWDGKDGSAALNPTGLGGIDLLGLLGCSSACGQINATVNYADQAFTYDIRFYTDGTNWTQLEANTLFQVNAPYTSTYALSWFELPTNNYTLDGLPLTITQHGTGVDFNNLGAIEFLINSDGNTVSVDLTLDNVRALPEPGSMALVGFGLLGLAGIRRRKSA